MPKSHFSTDLKGTSPSKRLLEQAQVFLSSASPVTESPVSASTQTMVQPLHTEASMALISIDHHVQPAELPDYPPIVRTGFPDISGTRGANVVVPLNMTAPKSGSKSSPAAGRLLNRGSRFNLGPGYWVIQKVHPSAKPTQNPATLSVFQHVFIRDYITHYPALASAILNLALQMSGLSLIRSTPSKASSIILPQPVPLSVAFPTAPIPTMIVDPGSSRSKRPRQESLELNAASSEVGYFLTYGPVEAGEISPTGNHETAMLELPGFEESPNSPDSISSPPFG
ncbi:hypothetical protein NE237_022520 [Protea cynaroides]|uniref:Uncharacterized protein n=1 Tax=Protea cynaroides TaxID=273540 RepID=A0A9Q0K4A1_9MAGN|nr:hypothetical protein NE237_022520 [Protea cynaroides]